MKVLEFMKLMKMQKNGRFTSTTGSGRARLRGSTLALTGIFLTFGVVAGEEVRADFTGRGDFAQTTQSSPRFLTDSRRPTWLNGEVSYYYNPANQPKGISTQAVVNLIQTAARKWENVCNVRFTYLGESSAAPDVEASFAMIDRRNVIGWQALSGDKSNFDGYVSWWWAGSAPNLVDADMVINTASGDRLAADPKGLGALITHEMGHMLAIKHSDVQAAVMFANPYNSYAFQNTLRGDDAAACASLYGYSATSDADRLFNYAEQTLPQFLAPTGVNSFDTAGYHYRFYGDTNAYFAAKDNALIFLPAGGVPVTLGTLDQFLGAAKAAGF